jgi:hypothetical protein
MFEQIYLSLSVRIDEGNGEDVFLGIYTPIIAEV